MYLDEHKLPAFRGEPDRLRSTMCSYSSLAGQPCAACHVLNRLHHVKRMATSAEGRIAACRRSGIVPCRSNEELLCAGPEELFERLMAVTARWNIERVDHFVLDKEREKLQKSLAASQNQLKAYASKDPSHSELIKLLDKVHHQGVFEANECSAHVL